jgi:dienelactone hydrolase
LFAHDSASALTLTSTLTEKHVEGALYDWSYRVPGSSECTQAWMIAPERLGSFPFVVFLHGGGQNRGAFLNEALRLAVAGVASLLVDLPQARAFPDFLQPEKDQALIEQTVLSVTHGMDCLAIRSDIDLDRGAIIGFSFGAWIGSVVAATDARIRGAVLTSGVPRMSEFWRASPHPDVIRIRDRFPSHVMDRYVNLLKPSDAIEHLRLCSQVCLFFQFGSEDELISPESVSEFVPYGGGDNRLKIYESASHYQMFFNPDARQDRMSWIHDQFEVRDRRRW